MKDDIPILHDTFERDVRRGRVVGSTTSNGGLRLGIDRHRSMAIDHGALRIVSLRAPGWGDTALAYGPFEPSDGLAIAALVLNGHNTAQAEPLGEGIKQRFKRWMKGNEVDPWPTHVAHWVLRGRKAWTLRRFTHWIQVHVQTRRGTVVYLDENFSFGFLPNVGSNPATEGNSFVVHATGVDNGELWVVSGGRVRPVLAGVRNVPLFLLAIVHGDRVVHYAASISDVAGLPALPYVRPLAVVPLSDVPLLYPALQQAVSGQIGFAADTRVCEIIVADLDGGSLAVESESMAANELADSAIRAPRSWRVAGGAGLIRLVCGSGSQFAIAFREAGEVAWTFRAMEHTWQLCRSDEDVAVVVAEVMRPVSGEQFEVQISDDGASIGIFVDDDFVFGRWIEDRRDADAEQVSLEVARGTVRSIEVHPRHLLLPPVLHPLHDLPRASEGQQKLLVDTFDGPPGELAGRPIAGSVWTKSVGRGRFLLTGGVGLRVDASAASPLPGRVAYTIPSPAVGAVEIEIDVMPPGTERGQDERGRAGVIFEQDDGDALIVSTWLDDIYLGASISSFFRLGGFEDLYDAVWTNVGDRVRWGQPYRLRVAFDGLVYEAFLDDELVLYRSLVDVDPQQPPLRIARIGIVANWEWGTDTGSVFRRCEVRGRAPRCDAPGPDPLGGTNHNASICGSSD